MGKASDLTEKAWEAINNYAKAMVDESIKSPSKDISVSQFLMRKELVMSHHQIRVDYALKGLELYNFEEEYPPSPRGEVMDVKLTVGRGNDNREACEEALEIMGVSDNYKDKESYNSLFQFNVDLIHDILMADQFNGTVQHLLVGNRDNQLKITSLSSRLQRAKEALEGCKRLDKTIYDYAHTPKDAIAPDGKMPPVGERWETPREIARQAIADIEKGE